MRRKPHPEAREDRDAKRKIEVEPEQRRRPEQRHANHPGGGRLHDMSGEAIPERHRQRRPGEGGPKEQLGPGKKRNEHWGGPLSLGGDSQGGGCGRGLNTITCAADQPNASFLKIKMNSSCSAKMPGKIPG